MSSSSEHSFISYTEKEALHGRIPATGSYRIRYQHRAEWDFNCDVMHPDQPVDLSLLLPHYRAQGQPTNHRMNMFIGSVNAPIRTKVCRNNRTRFYLEIQAMDSDVTVWLPSDFNGAIQYSGKASYSPGFTNKILRNVYINEKGYRDIAHEDSVVVRTAGHVTFRMWDIHTGQPENTQKETLKRLFGSNRRPQESRMDWDFLLDG